MKISIVLPAFNESSIAEESVRSVDATLATLGVPYEIIVSDDGSDDDTKTVVERAALPTVRVLRWPHRGKGAALTSAFRETCGEIVGFIDIDLEISDAYLPEFVSAIGDGADVVIASKVMDRESSRKRPWKRRLTTAGYNWLVRLLFQTGLGDHQAGLKLFRREALIPVLPDVESEGWLWDTEVLARCVRDNRSIREIGVSTRPVRPGHVSVVGTSWEMLTRLFDLRKRLNGSQ